MCNLSKLARLFVFVATALLIAPDTGLAQAKNVNATAHYLAGMPINASSPLAKLTKTGSWRQHEKLFNSIWNNLEKRQLSKIRKWTAKHVPKPNSQMLYMFSGPDFIYANAFFPRAKTYVLSGLEPVGNLPDIARLSNGGRHRALHNLRASTHTILRLSFFITKDMKVKLRSGGLNGTTPILYVFLARAGKTLHSAQLVYLNKDGTISPAKGAKRSGRSPGVKITYSGKDNRSATLYYFQTDLSNGGLKRSGFMKFSGSLGPADSLIKSASYLLHSGNFSTARKFLIKQTATLIQDDSGIPIRYLANNQWRLHPFGRYLGPINVFPGRHQRGMRLLFSKKNARKIDFGMGYRWRVNQSNVLLAIKQANSAEMKLDKK